MKTFAELESLDMKWVKGKRLNLFKPIPYQLTAENGQVLATITPGNRATKATVDAPGNRWTFERKVGLLKSIILIKSVGTGEQPATFTMGSGGSTLEYPDGRVFHWKKMNWLQGSKWVWTDADGSPILGMLVRGPWQRGDVHLDPDLDVEKAPPLLLFLGWYLILLQHALVSTPMGLGALITLP